MKQKRKYIRCEICNGKGYVTKNNAKHICETCAGVGKVEIITAKIKPKENPYYHELLGKVNLINKTGTEVIFKKGDLFYIDYADKLSSKEEVLKYLAPKITNMPDEKSMPERKKECLSCKHSTQANNTLFCTKIGIRVEVSGNYICPAYEARQQVVKENKMRKIISSRQTGKTTTLIKISAETGYYIVCDSIKEADRILKEAQKMNLAIPQPITYFEFVGKQYSSKGIKGVLIDNADHLLQYISRVPVVAITLTK